MPAEETHPPRLFSFILAYRWTSLLPALWLWIAPGSGRAQGLPTGVTLAAAVGLVLLITLAHRLLNVQLVRRPYLLGIDMLFAAGLLAVSGGARSPYYLYALSPLWAAAFFFQIRGALIAAAAVTPLYLAALMVSWRYFGNSIEAEMVFTQLAGVWLIGLLFGYLSVLLKQLGQTHTALSQTRDDLFQQNLELSEAHRQLKLIHNLTILLQATPDIRSVQKRVLTVVTQDLGFPKAAVGLVDPVLMVLGGWLIAPDASDLAEMPVMLLRPESGLVAQSLLQAQRLHCSAAQPISAHEGLNARLGPEHWLILPLFLRENPVGVLLIARDAAAEEMTAEQTALLDLIADQAAVTLGTTVLCIDRARRLAVEQERNRIAKDIHDTVAQSLFGIVFSLEACIAMLPDQVGEVKQDLIELRELAGEARLQVRRSILDLWPSELTLERFKTDLSSYATHCSGARPFQVHFVTAGDFNTLSPTIRRALYRVAQEALANTVHHAGVEAATVTLHVGQKQVDLCIADEGVGFDPQEVGVRQDESEHFGLRGIQQRVHALGGEMQIRSQIGQGAVLSVSIPADGGSFYG